MRINSYYKNKVRILGEYIHNITKISSNNSYATKSHNIENKAIIIWEKPNNRRINS